MRNKLRKYKAYLVKFAESPDKKTIIKDLTSEIKNKGVITGFRSYLHKKVHLKGGLLSSEPKEYVKPEIEKFDVSAKVCLPHNEHPRVSIIIPMYNQLEYSCDCVYSIYRNCEDKDYEVIIADDNSPLESSDVMKEYFENIIIIKNETNLGFIRNCNNAASKAKGDYLLFLNNDTQVQKGWLEELLNIFRKYGKVGIAGSKLVYPDGSLQEAGGIKWKDGSAWNYGNQDDPTKCQFNYVKETDYISGASLMVRRSLWDELGGFDELYVPAYCEDSDLCFRVREKGYKVMYQPFSVVVHFEGVSHGTDVRKGVKQYQVLNQKKFAKRWQHELKLKAKNGENVFFERDRSRNKKHVLVVDHYLPTVDKDAGSRTISNFMDSMVELGYVVHFLGENQVSFKAYEKAYQEKGIEVLYGDEYSFHFRKWKEYLIKHLHDFDAVLMSRSHVCAPLMSFLRNHHFRGTIMYYGHDLGYLRLEQEAILTKDDELKKQAKKIKSVEDFMYQNADVSFYISQEEADYLKKYIVKPLHYVPPYFFDVAASRPGYEAREGIFFIGGFNHPPNREGMMWFLDEVYAPLHAKNIKLTIAGSKMPQELFAYQEKYNLLSIRPDVSNEELETLYANTRIAIVPLRSGAGVKGKVIEAMAKGVPVVGTDIAFEGMPKKEDYLYKGANTPDDMYNEIMSVYSSGERWEQLSQFGMKYVQENFSKDNMTSVFKKIIG
ncbi:MAG: putative glycosyltransferase [Flavipsychrobacter sp.]|jgi:GT2 family glycosyltransferase|nr:putative glycosyltransferase [Flavipsychrobacter sp.]